MGLKLRRIELVNIRSHQKIVFEPEAQGITALQGENGRGKSTIIDSIPWALFGTKPNGVSKANEIFRVDADLTDKAYARIDLDVDGQRYRFERRRVNKNGGIEAEVFLVTEENGEEVLKQLAGPAVTHAEKYTRKLLKMDEKGFLAAILVQQKQVDQLISAPPRERGAVIEKLTGIAGVTAAVTEAKQELNTLRKAAAMSTIDEAGLQKLKEQEADEEKRLVDLREKQESLKAQASKLKEEGGVAKEKLEAASALWERKNAIETRLVQLKTAKELKDEELERTNKEKEEERRSRSTSTASYEDLEQQVNELEAKQQAAALTKSRSEDELARLKVEIKNLEAELEALAEAKGDAAKLVKKAGTLEATIKEAGAEINGCASELKQLDTAVKVISHGDSCPTCLQKVDDAAAAVKALELAAAAVTKRQEQATARLEKTTEELNATEQLLASLKRKAEITERLKVAQAEVADSKRKIDEAGAAVRVVEKELKSARGMFDEAKRNRERDQAYRRLLEKAQKLTTELEEIEFEVKKLKAEAAGMDNSSQREVNGLQRALDDLRAKHSKVSMEYTSVNGEVKLCVQTIHHLRENIKRHEEDIKRHHELIQSVAVAASSHEVIAEFREERIKNSVPVIEVYASDLLSRFTEGKFTRLSMNEKFEATVYLADGTSRAVGLLSGGELSAAAMALRLAISMLLNSGAGQNLIVLDEVLVSQDVNRAELILATLKEVFKGQVVLIAHNEAIDSVADKIVKLGGPEHEDEAEADAE